MFPLVTPFYQCPGIYKTKIMHTQDGNKDLKDDMINLSKFRMIADIISEIKLYQNEKYKFIPEKSIQVRVKSYRFVTSHMGIN